MGLNSRKEKSNGYSSAFNGNEPSSADATG